MAERRLETLVDELHRAAAESAAVSDSELLARFVQSRDAAAFELLVWRHAALVQAVCRRVLGRSPDVDDAFQATFLVLLRRARSIRSRESLAGWLHRVALRVAQRCRVNVAARWRREQHAARPESIAPELPDDLGPLLHAEIDRLPERLRLPLVLCALEGKTNEEAARLLGLPHGTILSRLSRARERLRWRLAQRGITAASAGAAALLPSEPASAALIDAAIQAALTETPAASPAAALAQGVIQAMFMRKLTTIATGTLAATLILGVGLTTVPRFATSANAGDEPAKPAAKPPAAEAPRDQPETKPEPPANLAPVDLLLPKKTLRVFHPDEDRIIGDWKVNVVAADGERRDPEEMRIVFGPFGTMSIVGTGVKSKEMTYKLDPGYKPGAERKLGAIELTVDGKSQIGIYAFGPGPEYAANETLVLCLNLSADPDRQRPKEFKTDKGSGTAYFGLTRRSLAANTNWAEKLFVKGRSHDLGEVKRSEQKVTHRFVVKNVYDRPINVDEIHFAPDRGQSGGRPGMLTAASLVQEIRNPHPSGWLQPGEETTVEVGFRLSDFRLPPLAQRTARIVYRVTFEVKGLTRIPPEPALPGAPGAFGPMGGMPMSPGAAASANSARGASQSVRSSTELTLTLRLADEKPN